MELLSNGILRPSCIDASVLVDFPSKKPLGKFNVQRLIVLLFLEGMEGGVVNRLRGRCDSGLQSF